MANRGWRWDWEADEEKIFALASEPDTYNYDDLARKLGRPRTTIVSAAKRHAWRDRLNELFKSNEPVPNLKHDVLSRQGRDQYRQATEYKWLKQEVKRLQGAIYEQETAFDRFVDASREPREEPSFKYRPKSGPKVRDIILHISDWHYGQLVLPESVAGGVNVFNREVFEHRLDKYVQSVCSILEDMAASHTYENLVFVMGGDMLEGLGVFEGQEWHVWEDPMVQVVNACDLYCGAMHEIMGVAVENCGAKNVSVLAVPGNHGKPGGRKAGATPSTYSFDWLLYKLIEKDLSNYPLYNFAIEPAGECYFVSQDHTISCHHGDEVRGWGGLPFYGIARHDAKTIRANHIINDYALLGHHHQQAEIPVGYGVTYISGNAVGPNNLKRFVGSGPAQQRLFLTSQEHGVALPLPIYLQTREERLIKPTVHAVGA